MGHRRRRAVASLLATVSAVSALQGCTWQGISYGCSDRDSAFSSTLADLAILAEHPADAESAEAYAGCDPDDGFAYAGRTYRVSFARSGILAFYRHTAVADGWHLDGENPPPPTAGLVVSGSASCYSKQVEGTTAYLAVWFPDDLLVPGAPAPATPYATFGVEVTASHDSGAWC
ncbi:MAG TPA: hypothetical protein VFG35_02155 [Actinoplanes sp.]|nr:hypothetical protein [Actinoplanes sp.]